MRIARRIFTLGMVMLLTTVPCLWATDYTWSSGVSGNWGTSANWSPSGVPGAGANDTAAITASGSYTVTLDSSPANSLTSLTLNDSAGTAKLVVTNAVVNTSTFTIGDGGTLELENGCAMTNGAFNLSGTTATIILNGSTFEIPPDSRVGSDVGLTVTNTSGVHGTWNNPLNAAGPGYSGSHNVNISYYGVDVKQLSTVIGLISGLNNGGINNTMILGPNTTWDGAGSDVNVSYGFSITSNNTLIIESGCVLTNFAHLEMGPFNGNGFNTLVINRRAKLYCSLGFDENGAGDSVLIDGAELNFGGKIEVFNNESCNSMVITNGGKLSCTGGDLCNYYSNNVVTVTGAGSLLQLTGGFYFGYHSGHGNVMYIRDGGTFECNQCNVGEGSDSIFTNVGGIYQFSTTSDWHPSVSGATLGMVSLVNGKIAFRNCDGVDININQPGQKLSCTANILYSGSNGFILDGATNLSSGQAYTFAPGTATNWVSLTLRSGAIYQGGDVTIGAGGSLLTTNGANTIASNLVMQSGSTLALDLGANTNSSLNVQGTANFSGGSLQVGLSAVPPIGYSYPIIQVSGACTDFSAKVIAVSYGNQNYTFEITHIGNIIALIRQPPSTGVFFH